MNKLSISVPLVDCDLTGRVHHSHLIEYGERGRISLLAANGITIDLAIEWGLIPATSKIEAQFFNSAKFGDSVTVETYVKHMNSYKVTTNQTLLANDLVVAEIRCVTVFLDAEGEPKQIPEHLR